jgi:hypothetical protein
MNILMSLPFARGCIRNSKIDVIDSTNEFKKHNDDDEDSTTSSNSVIASLRIVNSQIKRRKRVQSLNQPNNSPTDVKLSDASTEKGSSECHGKKISDTMETGSSKYHVKSDHSISKRRSSDSSKSIDCESSKFHFKSFLNSDSSKSSASVAEFHRTFSEYLPPLTINAWRKIGALDCPSRKSSICIGDLEHMMDENDDDIYDCDEMETMRRKSSFYVIAADYDDMIETIRS